jgi:SAM-dependent methyltransferase
MSFGEFYARAYDAFYRSKDYAQEARFVLDRISGGRPLRILDLGCGTGLHAIEMVQAGHMVTGVDFSAQMLSRAEARRDALPAEAQGRLGFRTGDARTVRCGATFDAVISLFHVMSYMAGDSDFDAALATARAHLEPGGLLLFDFWYGPAVLADPPQSRERVVNDGERHIKRTTTPHWDRERDVVRIAFGVEETDLPTGRVTRASEEHVMRYYFADGLKTALSRNGFDDARFGEWLTGHAPTPSSFGVYVLAKAV